MAASWDKEKYYGEKYRVTRNYINSHGCRVTWRDGMAYYNDVVNLPFQRHLTDREFDELLADGSAELLPGITRLQQPKVVRTYTRWDHLKLALGWAL